MSDKLKTIKGALDRAPDKYAANPIIQDLRWAIGEIERLQQQIDGYVAGFDTQHTEIERLREALVAWDMDPHHYSKRPCRTCRQISVARGAPFGCVRYALTGRPYITKGEATEATEAPA